jgi:hypothetical protein
VVLEPLKTQKLEGKSPEHKKRKRAEDEEKEKDVMQQSSPPPADEPYPVPDLRA